MDRSLKLRSICFSFFLFSAQLKVGLVLSKTLHLSKDMFFSLFPLMVLQGIDFTAGDIVVFLSPGGEKASKMKKHWA